MQVLVIDVGGSHVKLLASGQSEPRRFSSGDKLTPEKMMKQVHEQTGDWQYEAISLGVPGLVGKKGIEAEPVKLGDGWVHFDFAAAFGKPVKVINDAAMQALGAYDGGRMLFLGLGTGLGSAMVVDGVVEPMELAHLPYRKRTFEDYVGVVGLKRLGKKKWRRYVTDVVQRLQVALQADYVVLGGGNAKLLKTLPANVRLGSNANAFIGGARLWNPRTSIKGPSGR